jgi:hypothetical protein
MHVNLLLSVKTDSINKGSKIIFACGRQFIKDYNRPKGNDEKTKQECLIAYGERQWLTLR